MNAIFSFDRSKPSLGSNETERVVVVNGTAVVDVWHGIFGPLRFIEPLAKSIGATFDGIQEYFVDCDKRSQFPILNFHINGHVLQLKGMEYTYQVNNGWVAAGLLRRVPG